MTFVAENAKGDKDAPSYFGGGHLTSTQYWTKLFFVILPISPGLDNVARSL